MPRPAARKRASLKGRDSQSFWSEAGSKEAKRQEVKRQRHRGTKAKMSRKSGNFFERYVDKMVLGVAGAVCVWLLITWVLTGGNYVEYMGDKVGAGQIDHRINMQARRLRDKLDREPATAERYIRRSEEFKKLIGSAIGDIDVSLHYPLPSAVAKGRQRGPYDITVIGQVAEVKAGLVSGVAYVPIGEVGPENTYSKVETDLDDLDLVTVEGTFDVAGLYERFHESFSGGQDEENQYVEPVFACVHLQRQRGRSNGGWPSEDAWEDVPQPKNNHLKAMLEIPEKVDELADGRNIEILMIQFNQPDVWIGLLQPEPYDFDSPAEKWLPPKLGAQRAKRLQEEEVAEERERREEAKVEKERERRERRRSRPAEGRAGSTRAPGDSTSRRGTSTRSRTRETRPKRRATERGRGSMMPDMLEMMGLAPSSFGPGEGGRPYKEARLGGSGGQEEEDFEKILITEETEFDELEKLVFWAHDDSAEPGGTYRYRMRIGVFNPIAGTDQFSEESKALKDDVFLWSSFSELTDEIKIPGRLYFFPRKVARAAKSVTVQVSKKLLGKWYSEDFVIRPGETIGEVKDLLEAEKPERTSYAEESGPEQIDYRTGTILVDVADVSDWGGVGVLHCRNYPDMLYTRDGVNIEHLPIKESYWPEELRKKFKEIKEQQKREEEQETSTARSVRRPGQPGRGRRQPGGFGDMPWMGMGMPGR